MVAYWRFARTVQAYYLQHVSLQQNPRRFEMLVPVNTHFPGNWPCYCCCSCYYCVLSSCGGCAADQSDHAHSELKISVDNTIMELYVDGARVNHLPNAGNWVLVDSVTLKWWTTVIAVRAHNVQPPSPAGVVASDSRGRALTNAATWKCRRSPVAEANWMSPDYDDSSWPSAAHVGRNGDATVVWYGTQPTATIDPSAWWVWTPCTGAGIWVACPDEFVYCRGRLQ